MLYFVSFRGVAQSGRVLGLGPRCRRFESFRPDHEIQTVANAAVLILCLELRIRTANEFAMVRTFPSSCHTGCVTTAGHS